jgi:magnesium-protoporphyrin IX monomethyl ester (oxidative) cyclase
MSGHVLLIYPSCEKNNPDQDSDFHEGWTNIPIGILSIGTYINDNGYDVDIIDCRIHKKSEILPIIKSKIRKDTICVGFSMMTMQIGHGLELIDHIKKKYHLPILVGGIHGTLFPEQTISEKNIDYVIVGEGELSVIELLKVLDKNHEHHKTVKLENISGLCYKKGSKFQNAINKVGQPLSVELLPFPKYELLGDMEVYITRKFYLADGTFFTTRTIDLHTSRGCPYQCTFCINTLPCFKKWRSKNLEDILAHIDYVVKKYKIDFIWFMDDFFFGRLDRVKAILEHIVNKKHKLRWEATIRANIFSEHLVNDSMLKLMKKSGCYSLGMGFESGANRILEKIKKSITTKNIIHAVKQCKKYDIMPRGSFICGFPTETKKEVLMTGELILTLKKIYPKGIYYSPGILRPYPGAELYRECLTYGFVEPKTLREWASKDFNFGLYMSPKELPWIKYPNWLRNYQIYLHLATLRMTSKYMKKPQSLPYKIFGELSLFRIKHKLFIIPWEPPLLILANKIFKKS